MPEYRVTPATATNLNPDSLLPKRNPNLIQRIAAAVFRVQPQTGPQASQQVSTQSGVIVQALQSVYDQYFRSQSDRLAVYKDVDEMDQAAEEVSVALDTIADNVTTSEDGQQMSFSVQSEDQRVQDIVDQVNTAANLDKAVYAVVRNLVKYGDMFAEIVVNGQGQVVELRQLPPSTMFRNEDSKGNFVVGQPQYDPATSACLNKARECAFEQRAEDTQQIVAAFWPWQIVHGRLNWDGFKPYGRSHLRVTRIIWKKLKAIEESMIIARLTRAYGKYLVKVDTTGLSPDEARDRVKDVYQSVNQRQAIDGRREQPYAVTSDLFLAVPQLEEPDGKLKPNASNIEVLEAKNDALFEIADVKDYFHRKMLVTLRVPPAHMGWEEQVNAKATLTQQDVQYVRFLRRVQQLTGQCLEQVYDTALVLAGIDPGSVEYEISWPSLNATDEAAAADSEFARAQADQIYADLQAINAEWIQKHRFDMTDEDIEEMREQFDKEAQEAAKLAANQPQPTGAVPVKSQPASSAPKGDDDAELDQERGAAVRPAALILSPGREDSRRGTDEASSRLAIENVRLLAEAIRSRSEHYLRPDMDRLLDSSRDAVEKAQAMSEDVA